MTGPKYTFDTCPERSGFGSLKWDKYKGGDILPLWVADMDFTTAPEILDALQARLEHGVFGYTVPYETPVQAVLDYLSQRHGYKAEAPWLDFLPGLVPALNICCRAFTQPGESVLTTTPVYPPFLSAPQYADRELITVPLALNQNNLWTLDFDALEAAVRPDPRLFILCNPHNPVGRVYTREELTELADFCLRHDLILVSDEIHCDLIIDPTASHITTATLSPEIARRTITLMAASKTYNLPGLACAYSIIEDDGLRQKFRKTFRGLITEVNCFGYTATAAAYKHGEPWRQALIHYLRSNHQILADFVQRELPGIQFHPMQATYLAWLDVSALGLARPAAHFEAHGVGLSDGTPFHGRGHLRLNFGCPRDRLLEALEKIARAVEKA